MNNWYKDNIEEPIRPTVHHLRNQGFNTTCSCGHNMTIELDYQTDGELQRLKDILTLHLQKQRKPIDFLIEITINVHQGHTYNTLTIWLNREKHHAQLNS